MHTISCCHCSAEFMDWTFYKFQPHYGSTTKITAFQVQYSIWYEKKYGREKYAPLIVWKELPSLQKSICIILSKILSGNNYFGPVIFVIVELLFTFRKNKLLIRMEISITALWKYAYNEGIIDVIYLHSSLLYMEASFMCLAKGWNR